VSSDSNDAAKVNITAVAEFPNGKGTPDGYYIFKWYVDGVLIEEQGDDDGISFDDTQVANVGTLIFSNLNSSIQREYEVYCFVEYFVGTGEGAAVNSPLKSETATVTVLPILVIDNQPDEQVVSEGQEANFSISASLPDYISRPSIDYQWRINGSNLADGELDPSIFTGLVPIELPPSLGGSDLNRGKWIFNVEYLSNPDEGSRVSTQFELDWSTVSSFDQFIPGPIYTFTPDKDTRVKISMTGGSGGGYITFADMNANVPPGSVNNGTPGGAVTGEVTFLGGVQYTLIRGEAGRAFGQGGGWKVDGIPWTGGFPGGGPGNQSSLRAQKDGSDQFKSDPVSGGGGGGFTAIFDVPIRIDSTSPFSVNFGAYLNNVVMVAGGGGGYGDSQSPGGRGGLPNGTDGGAPRFPYIRGHGATQSSGTGGALRGGQGVVNARFDKTQIGGGGGGGYYGGGGGNNTIFIQNERFLHFYSGGGGGGSSYASAAVSNAEFEYPRGATPSPSSDGTILFEFISNSGPPTNIESIIVSGSRTQNLSITATGHSYGAVVDCVVSSSQAVNSPLYSDVANYQVFLPTNTFNVQALNNSTGGTKNTKVDIDALGEVVFNQDSFGSDYDIIQFTPPEKDVTTQIKLVASGGNNYARGGQNFSGGRGGMSILDFTFKKNVEYTVIGVSNNSALFFYEKANLVAVVGQGGDAGAGGRGGDGGGVNVDGTAGVGIGNNTAGGDRPSAGSLTNSGVYGSIMSGANINLYLQDSIARGSDGGRTVSCSKGNYWIERGYSPCSDITNKKIKFVTSNGQEVSDSMEIFRGFKSGYTITETAGKGASKSGNGGNGATGGDGGVSGAGGGGGSGYVDSGVVVNETRSGGNTAKSSYFTIGNDLPKLPTTPTPPSGLRTVTFTVEPFRVNLPASVVFNKISGNGIDSFNLSNRVSYSGLSLNWDKYNKVSYTVPLYSGSVYRAYIDFYWFLGKEGLFAKESSSTTLSQWQTFYRYPDTYEGYMFFSVSSGQAILETPQISSSVIYLKVF
jgi:hypothetical protein